MVNWLSKLFLQNFLTKLISLLLAFGLWLAVARDPVAEVELQVPIEFHNLPENLEIDSATFTQAQIRLRGPERAIHQLALADVRADVDLSNVQPGERTFDLTARHVHVPQDLQVVQIIPGQFRLSFDIRETRSVEIRPRVIGNFLSGTRIAQVISDPPTVTITGPRRRVQAVETASTDPVDASGTIDRGSFLTQVYVGDPLIQVVHPRPVRVTVIMGRGEPTK
jgi:diadenylate cyclase